jgi:acyl-CoA synthetase (AMP-forming)/AMP-acid ligase II
MYQVQVHSELPSNLLEYIINLESFFVLSLSLSLSLPLKVTFYIGELCRYLLAQPDRPTDTQHNIRLCIGNGLRPQIWTAFTKRFGIANIVEFYGATEGTTFLINPFNKPGACGFSLKIFTMLKQELLIKVYIVIIVAVDSGCCL